jgi:alpha-1,2-mannosyltransferase
VRAPPARSRPTASGPATTAGDLPPSDSGAIVARRLALAALPILAILAFVGVVGATLWAGWGADTLGYDFLAYHQAANRVLAGERLYDPTIEETGGFGLYYYPPPFIFAILPLAPLDPTAAPWLWAGLSAAAFLGGIALMPVPTTVRWVTLLLAGLSWPTAYAFKLGQVGPLLFLLFTIGWRWLDRPAAVGGSAAAGAIVKIQPGLILVWALLTRRWQAVAVGSLVLVVTALAATLTMGGLDVWTDYVALLRNVSDPISTPHNFTPGAVAYQLGVPTGVAGTIQLVSTAAAAAVVVLAALRASAAASYLVAATASQLLSPVLWDHYAMLLLLPVAWLIARRQWWAIAIPLSAAVFLIGITPPIAYPAAFWLTLFALLAVGWRERAGDAPA